MFKWPGGPAAKENLPGGSLKFVYLKVRILKGSYRR